MLRARTTAVTGTPPITVGELKDWLKLPSGQVDSSLPLIVASAVQAVADKIRQTVVQESRILSFDLMDIPACPWGWWDGTREGSISSYSPPALELWGSPVQSVTAVVSYDLNNTAATYGSSNYRLDKSDPKQQARLILNLGAVWPTNLRRQNSLEVEVVAGYADGTVPSEIKMAMLMVAAWGYTNRAPCSGATCDACGASGMLKDLIRVEPGMGRPRRTPRAPVSSVGMFGEP